MKATYNATIKQVHKDHVTVELAVVAQGKVDDAKIVGDAKLTSMDIVLRLKPVVADQLKLGAKLTITLSDEEPTKE